MPTIIAVVFGLVAASADTLYYAMHGTSLLSDLAISWILLRYGVSYLGALVVGYIASKVRLLFWLLLVVPPLSVGHGLFLGELGTISNLWPPLFFVDVLLFLPCFPLMQFSKNIHLRMSVNVK